MALTGEPGGGVPGGSGGGVRRKMDISARSQARRVFPLFRARGSGAVVFDSGVLCHRTGGRGRAASTIFAPALRRVL
jgi:hypothetical protein